MARIHTLGLPRIGKGRELKFALEAFWQGQTDETALEAQAQCIRYENWQLQQGFDWVPVGDFSFYDHVLDTSFMLGHLPDRLRAKQGGELQNYFRVARGRASFEDCHCMSAAEMTKWFDTNYHYIVPEISATTRFELRPERILAQIEEAQQQNVPVKPVLVGPLTYLWLSKSKDGTPLLDKLQELTETYQKLLTKLSERGVQWVQLDEPILVTELDSQWLAAFERCYHKLNQSGVSILLASYFGRLQENLSFTFRLPVAGVHIDGVNGRQEIQKALDWLPAHQVLSIGIIDGRNIWKTPLNDTLDLLEPIAKKLGDRLWIAPSCSLLHVPVDLELENNLNPEIKSWMSFAVQKLEELKTLKTALNHGRKSVKERLEENARAINSRRRSESVIKPEVQQRIQSITNNDGTRKSPFPIRSKLQKQFFKLPLLPTTTIGSFPQTSEIRKSRRAFKAGDLDKQSYTQQMQAAISHCITEQEKLGLDVFVHGEAERNDMVEYFGEQLEGYIFSEYGWVQSYGSRCVKPPIIYGDIVRSKAMTLDWIQFAQSLTDRPVKGMLTGPVTMLNWSFVRDDQSRKATCLQLAMAIRDEVLALEKAGFNIIQIDEAALREGLPLRKLEWQEYLDWAVESFRICANGVADSTQIHTHMCYSEFNDIIDAIAHMDADVITIETSRSNMELLDVFDKFQYPNEIGPGVYDIHSPNIPTIDSITALMKKAAEKIPVEKLWINPDCGLKTRRWDEVKPALENLIEAAKRLRQELTENTPASNAGIHASECA